MDRYRTLGLFGLVLGLLACATEGRQANADGAPDADTGSYWHCEHAVMQPGAAVHRSYIAATVDDAGRVWAPFYQVLETNARYDYIAGENWREEGFVVSVLTSSPIQLDHAPTRPLWEQTLADGALVERQVAVPPALIARGEAHETIWGVTLRGDALARLIASEDWSLQVVDEDGVVVAERALKDRTRTDMQEEQRAQIAWLRTAAESPATYCTRSTPESRAADEASVI